MREQFAELLDELYNQTLQQQQGPKAEPPDFKARCTCDKCLDSERCVFAWNYYNVDGRCLAHD